MHKLSVPPVLLVCFCLFWNSIRAGNETGYPFIRNFSANQYKAHAQNFAITRDRNGIVYFGNFAGVLQFDGEFWRLIPTRNTTKVSSLAADSAGTIYVGARGEIGFLKAGTSGDLDFISIPELSGTKVPRFFEVNFTFSTSKGIFFITKNEIFNWSAGKLDIWKPQEEIISGFCIGRDIYLQLKEKGVVKYLDNSITPVTRGEILSGAIEIKAMLPFSAGQILVATGTQGLYVIGKNGVTDFASKVDPWFQKNMITSAVLLADGTYAIGTSRNGIVIMNADGTLKQVIDKKSQLQDNYVQSLFADHNNILWAALNNGISMIELPAPLSYFDDKTGLNGGVNCILRSGGKLYAATSQGLFQYNESLSGFNAVPDIITACWWMIPDRGGLLAATSQGIYSVSNGRGRLVAEGFSMMLIRSANNPLVVYSGQLDGLFELTQTGSGWKSRRVEGPAGEINDLLFDVSGDLWGSTISKEIFR